MTTLSQRLSLVLALLAGCLIGSVLTQGAFSQTPHTASPASPAAEPVGRYQLAIGCNPSHACIMLTDTQTGRVWYQADDNSWEDQSPGFAKGSK